MKSNRTKFFIFLGITILLDAFIIFESCMGGGASGSQSAGFTEMIIRIVEFFNPSSTIRQNADVVHQVVRKVFGHFLLFGLSGIFSTLTLLMVEDSIAKHNKEIIIVDLCGGIFLALLTEFIQLLTAGRSGQFTDVLIDSAGFILFGFIVYIIFTFLLKKKNKLKTAK